MNPITVTNPKGAGREPNMLTQHKRLLKSFALQVRETVDFAPIIARLVTMTEGKDPATGEPVSVHDQQQAAKILLERAFGMPAMSVTLEGTVRNELVASAPRPNRPTMSLEEINAARARLRDAGVRARVIDAEATEVLVEGAGTEGE